MVAPHSRHSAASGSVQLAYRLFGNADQRYAPVLFIHGLSYFSYDWVDFGSELCTDRAGCAMDMRGFGDSSESPSDEYSVSAMAEDIGNLLDHLGWRKPIIVAHSMGGRSATCFTARHPERVSALVLVDWSPENAPEGSKRVANVVANTPDSFARVEDAMQYFGNDPHSPAGQSLRERFEAYLRPAGAGFELKRSRFFRDQFRHQIATGEKPKRDVDLWELLRQLAVPTLVLRGSRSDLFAAETAPRVLAANPRIRLREIDAGHHVAGENPAAALAAIRTFITPLERA